MSDVDSKAFELKVGIFIACGILIFFIVVFSIGDVQFVKKGYDLNVVFDFANGITESAPVRFAGVNVGQVEDIQIFFDEEAKRTRVKLLARINNENIKIEKDSKVIINTLGLLGEKYLEIFPGTDVENILLDGDRITGINPVPTALMAEKAQNLIETISDIAGKLDKGEGTLGKLLTKDDIYNDMEALVEDIKKHPWKLLNKPRGY
jgi:phospholipid/cholesterol/gamma-HCH transport system substrate-binding protein